MFEDYCGTPLYMGNCSHFYTLEIKLIQLMSKILAPEIIENLPYSQLCDVWALGIIMFILYIKIL